MAQWQKSMGALRQGGSSISRSRTNRVPMVLLPGAWGPILKKNHRFNREHYIQEGNRHSAFSLFNLCFVLA
jgi:hypothetical protein